jgi:hypothetical protein
MVFVDGTRDSHRESEFGMHCRPRKISIAEEEQKRGPRRSAEMRGCRKLEKKGRWGSGG